MSEASVDRGPPPNIGQTPAGQRSRHRNRRGRGRGQQAPPRPEDAHSDAQAASGPPNPGMSDRRRNRGGLRQGRPVPSDDNPEHQLPPHLATNTADGGESAAEGATTNTRRRRGRGRGGHDTSTARDQPTRGRRRENFGGRLTGGGTPVGSAVDGSVAAPPPPPTSGDVTSRLIYSLTHKEDAVDCPICFNPVHPTQPIWSCAPSPVDVLEDASAAPTTCCWTIFHIRCIKQWAHKSVTATREAYRARDVDQPGDWRCPGCQTKRTEVPKTYRCFCARVVDPPPSRLATPHSCGEPCARIRIGCEHACPMACHPGPCPPCLVSVSKSCWCGSKTLVLRCSVLNKGGLAAADVGTALSCGQPCGRLLGCERHACEQQCHSGPCLPCEVVDIAKCYCGKEQKEMACGSGIYKYCRVDGEAWEGRWQCDQICSRFFDCGQHKCQKACHVPSTPAPCPFSPALVATCPCGKTPLLAPRNVCTDPIPTCSSSCSRPYSTCAHVCAKSCHLGPCPPCTLPVAVKCRCGETITKVPCDQVASGLEILCQKSCKALRGCGRHICNRVCCPLAGTASKTKGKKRVAEPSAALETTEDDPEGWHVCDLVCNKRLSCNNHNCMLPDHRGPCPRCLQSSFEELICPCNRTVIEPPVPCGTRINCAYPCAQPAPPCGHPRTPHTCHAADEDSACPPCPHLTNRTCDCGKTLVRNVRCSQERVSCGTACGKQLDCGYHACDRTCHTGECGTCEQVCGKPRRECGHPCPVACHAPSACPSTDAEPCPAVITVSCPCGRITQPAPCGVSRVLKCQDACSIAKRNARLADALGISESNRAGSVNSVTWSPDLMSFCRVAANQAFVKNVEKAFAEFVGSDKKAHVLPHMPEVRRKFVTEVAEAYRVSTQLVDEEPRRSVQLIRRPDSRVPTPTLSQASAPVPSRLGSLGDLRKPSVARPSPSTSVWRAVTPNAPPPNTSSNLGGATPGPGRGNPMSGNSSLGSSATVWNQPNVTPSARVVPAGSRSSPQPRTDEVPTNWEDE